MVLHGKTSTTMTPIKRDRYDLAQVNNSLKNNNYQLFLKKVSMSINHTVY